jgi:hypothetical protein
MAYMRGRYYLWGDGECLNIWDAGESGDHWTAEGGPNGDRVRLPDAVADGLALMRVAELVAVERVDAALDATLEQWRGNFGCAALEQYAAHLKERLAGVAALPKAECCFDRMARRLEEERESDPFKTDPELAVQFHEDPTRPVEDVGDLWPEAAVFEEAAEKAHAERLEWEKFQPPRRAKSGGEE